MRALSARRSGDPLRLADSGSLPYEETAWTSDRSRSRTAGTYSAFAVCGLISGFGVQDLGLGRHFFSRFRVQGLGFRGQG
jgi:hypothetical protein